MDKETREYIKLLLAQVTTLKTILVAKGIVTENEVNVLIKQACEDIEGTI